MQHEAGEARREKDHGKQERTAKNDIHSEGYVSLRSLYEYGWKKSDIEVKLTIKIEAKYLGSLRTSAIQGRARRTRDGLVGVHRHTDRFWKML